MIHFVALSLASLIHAGKSSLFDINDLCIDPAFKEYMRDVLKHPANPENKETKIKEAATSYLLYRASQDYLISNSETQKKSKFHLPLAKEYLNAVLSDQQNTYEQSLGNCSSQQLAQLELEAVVDGKATIPTACLLTKKFATGDGNGMAPMPDRAINWAFTLIHLPECDPAYFRASGAYQALESLTDAHYPLQTRKRAHHLLAHLGMREIQTYDFSHFEETKKHLEQVIDEPGAYDLLINMDAQYSLTYCKKNLENLPQIPVNQQPALINDLLSRCKQLISENEIEALDIAADIGKTNIQKQKNSELACNGGASDGYQ